MKYSEMVLKCHNTGECKSCTCQVMCENFKKKYHIMPESVYYDARKRADAGHYEILLQEVTELIKKEG